MTDDAYYAEILVSEWGQPDQYQIIGPCYAETADELEDSLLARGDYVLRIASSREDLES